MHNSTNMHLHFYFTFFLGIFLFYAKYAYSKMLHTPKNTSIDSKPGALTIKTSVSMFTHIDLRSLIITGNLYELWLTYTNKLSCFFGLVERIS